MRKFIVILFPFLLVMLGCAKEPQIVKEPWMDTPMWQWPNVTLTNKISFTDTTYTDIANSFLVTTGVDTISVSCKHFFMIFENQLGLKTIDLGNDFNYWYLYPKHEKKTTFR